MSATISTVLLIILTCLCMALAAFVASAEGHSWWRTDDGTTKIDIGLWRTCSKKMMEDEICTVFNDVLKFTDNRFDFDIVLTLLIVAGVSVLIGLPLAFSLLCCQRHPGRRKWISRFVAVFSFLGAAFGFISLGYAEVKFEADWNDSAHGWSVVLAWIASAATLLAFFLSGVILFLMSTTGMPKESFRMDRKIIPTKQSYPVTDGDV